MNNTVWLSGASGFVGSYVRSLLLDSGYAVKCLSSSSSEDENTIYVDFSKRDQISGALKKHGVPDTFIHLGWANTEDPHNENHITTNVQNGIKLIDELYDCGVLRFIFIGSSSEYGDNVGALKEDCLLQEGLNNYIEGKRSLGKYGLNAARKLHKIFIHVRLFYAYGAGQKPNSLINQLFRNSIGDNEMNLSPCEHYRDYIHVSEAAEGIRQLISVNHSGIINLGSGKTIQLKEFVKLFWKELGADPDRLLFGAHEQPSCEQSQPKAFADLSNLKKLTNWSPSLSIEEGMRLTVNAFNLMKS